MLALRLALVYVLGVEVRDYGLGLALASSPSLVLAGGTHRIEVTLVLVSVLRLG